MKQGLVRLLYNFGKRFMGWTLHMIMCVLLCYPVSIHMSQLLSTGRPISSCNRYHCVKNSSQTVPQLCVPQQSTASQPPCLVSRSGQLQEQGFSVEVAERIAAPQRSSTRTIYKSKWALFEKWCRENSVDFSTPSVKQVSDFFMYLYQDLNRRPSTIDGYRTAIVDTLGPTGHHIPQTQTLTGYSPVFSGIVPKFQESSKWNLFCRA